MKNLIYPDICFICGTFFNIKNKPINYISSFAQFEEVFVKCLCENCLKKYNQIKKPYCKKCGVPMKNTRDEDLICGSCLESPLSVARLRSSFLFKDSIVDIVHMLKYNNRLFLSVHISYFMFDLYLDLFKEYIPDYIIPVPMHKSKLRKRGYNQTYLIAKEMIALSKKHGIFFPKLQNDIIIKRKNTKSQTGLNAKERKNNLKNAFVLKNPSLVRGKKILLIDDVVTTGTTLNEISKLLFLSGAESVDALTFARAL